MSPGRPDYSRYIAKSVAKERGMATSLPPPGQDLKWRDDFEAA